MANIRGGSGTIGGYYYGQNYYAGMPSLSKNYIQNFVDNLSITDLIKRYGTRSFVEGLSIADIIHKLSIKSLFSDGIKLGERSSILKVFTQFFSDTMTMVDNFATDLDKFFTRAFVDTMVMTDNWSRKLDKLVEFIDGLTIEDVIGKLSVKGLFRDGIGLADSVRKTIGKLFADGIELAENFLTGSMFTLAVSDAIEITDNTFKAVGKYVTDVLHTSDSILRAIAKSFLDTMSLTDVFNKVFITFLALVDGIAMTDYSTRFMDRLFEDGIDLSESVLKHVNIILESAVSVRDSITRRLNGMIINWDKIKALVGDWIKRDKKNDGLTKMQRQEIAWSKQGQAIGTYTKQEKDSKSWTKFKGINDNEE